MQRNHILHQCSGFVINSHHVWGGWDKNSDELTRKIYILKNQSTVPMLVAMLYIRLYPKSLVHLKRGRPGIFAIRKISLQDYLKVNRKNQKIQFAELESTIFGHIEHINKHWIDLMSKLVLLRFNI